jgi:hypothetical protein
MGRISGHFRRIVVTLVVFLFSSPALANGGPADLSPGVTGGGIHFIQKTQVALTEESLAFVVTGDDVQINVAYTLMNKGKADKTAFAFPVDFYEEEYGCDTSCDYKAEKFQISDGDKLLPLTSGVKETLIDKTIDEVYIHKKVSRIYKTSLSFAAKEKKIIKVSYRVKAGFVNWMNPYSLIDIYDDRRFSYDLTPAGYWGNGKVDKLTISFDYRDIIRKGGSLKVLTLPKGTLSSDGRMTFSSRQSDLKSFGEFRVAYEYGSYLRNMAVNAHRVSAKQIASAKATSVLGDGYIVANLLDGKLSTAWVEGSMGTIGDSVTLLLGKGMDWGELRLINGYRKSKTTYESNARIKSLLVEKLVPDEDLETGVTKWVRNEVELEDKPYDAGAVAAKDLYGLSDSILYSETKLFAIRLTILETYPGSRYEDACISELILMK